MLITCLRHATAELYTLPTADAERALVRKGKDQVRRLVEFCREHGLTPDVLYSSPLLRARQTATLLQAGLPDCPSVKLVDWLGLGAEAHTIVAELKKLEAAGVKDVWLVGHEPDISDLISYLLAAPSPCILIKKASLTRVDVDFSASVQARLLWSVPCAFMQ